MLDLCHNKIVSLMCFFFTKAAPSLIDRFICIEGPLLVFQLDFLSAYIEFLQRLQSGTQSNTEISEISNTFMKFRTPGYPDRLDWTF